MDKFYFVVNGFGICMVLMVLWISYLQRKIKKLEEKQTTKKIVPKGACAKCKHKNECFVPVIFQWEITKEKCRDYEEDQRINNVSET